MASPETRAPGRGQQKQAGTQQRSRLASADYHSWLKEQLLLTWGEEITSLEQGLLASSPESAQRSNAVPVAPAAPAASCHGAATAAECP